MSRCGSTFLLAATLSLFGIAPMSPCASRANLPADCVPTPHCEAMGGEQPDTAMASQPGNCCQVGNAPVPQSKVQAVAPAVSTDRVAAPMDSIPSPEMVATAPAPQARSAPFDLQASLCIFLI